MRMNEKPTLLWQWRPTSSTRRIKVQEFWIIHELVVIRGQIPRPRPFWQRTSSGPKLTWSTFEPAGLASVQAMHLYLNRQIGVESRRINKMFGIMSSSTNTQWGGPSICLPRGVAGKRCHTLGSCLKPNHRSFLVDPFPFHRWRLSAIDG